METILWGALFGVISVVACWITERFSRVRCVDCGKALRSGDGDAIARECGIPLCSQCAGCRMIDNGGRDGIR